MYSRSTRTWLGLLAVAVLLISANGCEQADSSKLALPTYYADEVLDQARAYINQGYDLLDRNLVDEAVATFGKVNELIPNGLAGNYHSACAYGRSGNIDQAFVHLDRLLEAGYDIPVNLKEDPDFSSLRSDPRWESLVSQAQAHYESMTAGFAVGMPRYDQAPQTFTTIEDCDDWVKEEKSRMRKHRIVWTSVEYITARMDLAAQKLTCLASLKADDAEFDIDLEQVRESAELVSLHDPWSGVADLVLTEVENLLSNSPSDAARSEAHYLAGLALAMKYPADDDRRLAAYDGSKRHLEKVAEGTEFYPAARALNVVNQLRQPNTDMNLLGEELTQALVDFASDTSAMRILSTQYGPETVSHIWPVPIDLLDIDGQVINLADYKGKVLLIDFWATWCGPCRAELPGLLEMYEKYHPKGFEIVSISLDYEDRVNLEAYRAWIAEKGMTWRHIYDGQVWDTELAKRYFVSAIPSPFLVGPDGSLVAFGEACFGKRLEETLKKALGSV